MYDRLKGLFTEDNISKLNSINVLLVGVGGVGATCLEVLVRTGIKNITIVDYDTYEESNLNRQLHSNNLNIGSKKIEVLKKEMEAINPNIEVNAIDTFIDDKTNLNLRKFDYIIDACDSIKAKIYLITKANELGIKEISALGAGNRLDPSLMEITTLNKTTNDPLAKKLRYELKKINYNEKVMVASSKEIPIKSNPVSSYMPVASYSGMLLADYIIKDVINGSK